jgi:hypothetical protein
MVSTGQDCNAATVALAGMSVRSNVLANALVGASDDRDSEFICHERSPEISRK